MMKAQRVAMSDNLSAKVAVLILKSFQTRILLPKKVKKKR